MVALLLALLPLAAARAPPHRLSLFTSRALTLATGDAAASLDASPALVAHGDTITVHVTAVPANRKKCFVAAFLVGDNMTATAPLEYYNIACAAPATLSFKAFNARASWVFALGDGGLHAPRVLALSNAVAFSDVRSPRAVRLTPAAAPGAVRVAWTSAKPAAAGPRVLVRAAAGGSANATFPADTLHATVEHFCGGDATGAGYRDPGFFHTALVTGLTPGARYAYSVGDAADESATFEFRALPTAAANGAALYPFVMLAVGDMGQDTVDGSSEQYTFPPAPNTTRLMALDVAAGAQAVCHAGDISYARGFESAWELFHASLDGIAPYVPYGLDLGNRA